MNHVLGPLLLAVVTFFSTTLGGLFALRHRTRLQLIMGFAAGVVVGVVVFDLLPEIFAQIQTQGISSEGPMLVLAAGFLAFHVIEKAVLVHHGHEGEYAVHHHPTVGVLSGLALAGHSFLDGVGIGMGFKVSAALGVAVAIAVIAHDFTDGLNTVTLVLAHGNKPSRARALLMLDAIAPLLGAASTLVVAIPGTVLPYYLGFFAGFLLYIGASDILPQAHSDRSSVQIIGLTVLGFALAFLITRLA